MTVAFSRSRNLDWLTGRGYDSVAVTVPVRYTSADGMQTDGDFNTVTFDNLAEPMLLGRDLGGGPGGRARPCHRTPPGGQGAGGRRKTI